MAGYRRRRKKARTWEGSKKRHRQAAARGWRHHAPKGWRPKRPKWQGSIKSTAKYPVKRKKASGPSQAELDRATREIKILEAAIAKKHGGKKSAAKKGGKKGGKKSRDMNERRSWFGKLPSAEGKRHAQAAARGWHETSAPGWKAKYRGKKNPAYEGSLSSTAGGGLGGLFAAPKKVKKGKKLKAKGRSYEYARRRRRSRRRDW